MPKITKIRIVNCFYNNRERLIPDELYDLDDPESREALNTVMHLANGGGKTVLVQLFMQPVIPGAKAGGRRIEDYFQKPGDHCYFLLEWKLDGAGDMRLMTGISMAGSRANTDDESRPYSRVRYYSFFSTYGGEDNSPYSIAALDLSANVDGRFEAADYNAVRDLAKRSMDRLICYSPEEKGKWAAKLKEYGIFQDEWHSVIEALNMEEGGLNKYFDKAPTSDLLIRQFILPAIEKHENLTGASGKDDSLETMLVHYARKRAENSSAIQEKDTNERVLKSLEALSNQADALCSKEEEFVGARNRIFALKGALTREAAALDERKQALLGEMEDEDRTLTHIAWEQASSEYYPARDALSEVREQLSEKETEKEAAEGRLAELQQRREMLEYARYRDDNIEHEAKLKALRESVRLKEEESDEAAALADLRSRISRRAAAESQAQAEKSAALSAEMQKTDGKRKDLYFRRDRAENEKASHEAERNRKSGNLQTLKSLSDRIAEEHAFPLTRNLSGLYGEGDISALDRNLQEQKEKIENNIEAKVQEEDETSTRLSACRKQKMDLTAAQASITGELTALDKALKEYQAAVEGLLPLAQRYSLSRESLFDGSLKTAIHRREEETRADLQHTEEEIRDREKRLNAASSGSLHVPEEVMAYVTSTGLAFQTGEGYLLNLLSSGQLEPDRLDDLLERHPELAYSLLFSTEKDREALLNSSDETWLQEAVPVYTMGEFSELLSGEDRADRFLADYDASYFKDTVNYRERLEEKLLSCKQKKDLYEQRLSELARDADRIASFPYNANWEEEQKTARRKLIEKQEELTGKLQASERQEQDLLGKKEAIDAEIASLKDERTKKEAEIKALSSLQRQAAQEKELLESLIALEEQGKALDRELKDLAEQIAACEQDLKEMDASLKQTNERKEKLQQMLGEVGRPEEAAAVDVPWDEEPLDALYTTYKTLSASLSGEIEALNQQLFEEQKKCDETRRAMEALSVDPAACRDMVWSPEQERGTKADIEAAEAKRKTLEAEYNVLTKKEGKAGSDLEKAEKNLAEFGGSPLSPEEIKGNFPARRKAEEEAKARLTKDFRAVEKRSDDVTGVLDEVNPLCASAPLPEVLPEFTLEQNIRGQWSSARQALSEAENDKNRAEQDLTADLTEVTRDYEGTARPEIVSQLRHLRELLANRTVPSDRYGTVRMGLSSMASSIEKINAKIATDLAEIENERKDIIHQCVLRGEVIYKALQTIQSASRVKLQNSRPTQMIRFDIPSGEEVSQDAARVGIEAEIDQGAEEIGRLLAAGDAGETASEKDLKKAAARSVGSEKLLHMYIRRDTIPVKVYKIDQNSANSAYRTWEKALVQNSGGEKFVVFFSVILSIMNYSRSIGPIAMPKSTGVLIMDNPFGTITSGHLLRPVFEIAKHFHVQLICLTDINKADIIECFDNNIKLVVKSQPLSAIQTLTHEGNERIEHGYYKIINRQLSLF